MPYPVTVSKSPRIKGPSSQAILGRASCAEFWMFCRRTYFRLKCIGTLTRMCTDYQKISETSTSMGIFTARNVYKARHAHKRLYTVLPKYSKIQVLPGITSCRLVKDNKQAIELNSLLLNNMPKDGNG